MSRHDFTLKLDGLLQLLAVNIYSTPKVAVRELLQNAHDACRKRALISREPSYQPSIRLMTDRDAGTLTVVDNGAGMTEEDILRYLTTIGASGTRGLRQELICEPESTEFVGYFGIGFLSGFMLAEHVALWTRAAESPCAMRFDCRGDEQFDLTPVEGEAIGTKVVLQLKPEVAFLLDEARLRSVVGKYAEFLPTPVYVGEDAAPVNAMTPPWQRSDGPAAISEYLQQARGERPLAVIPLQDCESILGHDRITIPLSGFLWIPGRPETEGGASCELRVYVRRMLILDQALEMLPVKGMASGIIECPSLTPTASRESLVQDDVYLAVCQGLERQFAAALRRLSREDPARFKEIVLSYGRSLMAWAEDDAKFYDLLAPLLQVPTSQGLMTLPRLVRTGQGVLYFVTRQLGSLQEKVLAEANGAPTIDASDSLIERFVRRYSDRHEEVRLVQLDGSSHQLMQPVYDPAFSALMDQFSELAGDVRLASFRPRALPVVLICTERANVAREVRDAMQRGDAPAAVADLMQAYVENVERDESLRGTLVVNAASPLMRLLAGDSLTPSRRRAAAAVLYQQARLFAARGLTTREAVDAFASSCEAMKELCE